MREVSIRFINADRGHESPDGFLVRLTEAATARRVRIAGSREATCDIEFESVQYSVSQQISRMGRRRLGRLLPAPAGARDPRWWSENPQPSGRARSHVWFTGENVRPPVGAWSGYLSFDLDSLNGRNVYCPLWWWGIGLLGAPSSPFMSPAPDLETLRSPRRPDPSRTGFVAAFINNPHPMRMHAIDALREVGTVDVYGKAVGRPVPSKSDIARNYRFILCFENDVYPGYVTEKAIEAWSCGAVPIWWGSDPAGYLNSSALFSATDFESLTAMAEEVGRVMRDDDEWSEMVSRPLITRDPDLVPALSLIARLVDS